VLPAAAGGSRKARARTGSYRFASLLGTRNRRDEVVGGFARIMNWKKAGERFEKLG
jgi:hypothetical protein